MYRLEQLAEKLEKKENLNPFSAYLIHKNCEDIQIAKLTDLWSLLRPNTERMREIYNLQQEMTKKIDILYKELRNEEDEYYAKMRQKLEIKDV